MRKKAFGRALQAKRNAYIMHTNEIRKRELQMWATERNCVTDVNDSFLQAIAFMVRTNEIGEKFGVEMCTCGQRRGTSYQMQAIRCGFEREEGRGDASQYRN